MGFKIDMTSYRRGNRMITRKIYENKLENGKSEFIYAEDVDTYVFRANSFDECRRHADERERETWA
jgi:hypothetical protein